MEGGENKECYGLTLLGGPINVFRLVGRSLPTIHQTYKNSYDDFSRDKSHQLLTKMKIISNRSISTIHSLLLPHLTGNLNCIG